MGSYRISLTPTAPPCIKLAFSGVRLDVQKSFVKNESKWQGLYGLFRSGAPHLSMCPDAEHIVYKRIREGHPENLESVFVRLSTKSSAKQIAGVLSKLLSNIERQSSRQQFQDFRLRIQQVIARLYSHTLT